MKKLRVGLLVLMIMSQIGIYCFAQGVTIHRDKYGAHIYASTREGLYYGLGYATAEDRFFQLEMLSRTYFGEVAELFGSDYVALDYYWRNEFPDLSVGNTRRCS